MKMNIDCVMHLLQSGTLYQLKIYCISASADTAEWVAHMYGDWVNSEFMLPC